MKIFLQTLTKQTFPIECEPDDTVAQLKLKIEADRGDAPALQNLVFNGKVLTDTSVLSAVGIKDGSKVIYFSKKAAKPAAPQPAPAQTSAPAATAPPTTPAKETTPADPAPAPVVSTPATQESAPSEPSAPKQPERSGLAQDEAKLKELMDMGFTRDKAQQALSAADGNLQIAIEYLMSGIPEGGVGMGGPVGMPNPFAAPQQSGAHPYLDELRTHPQINQIRQILAANPQALQTLLPEIARSSPQLAQEIVSNPGEFASVLAGLSSEALTGMRDPSGAGDDDDDEEEEEETIDPAHPDMPMMPPTSQPAPAVGEELTDEDKTNILQIMAITNASRGSATEAYLVCGKNVENAINFLFDS